MPLSPVLANNIAKVKNYVDDPNNLYSVFRAAALTSDLETPFVQFIGASTMSYPVMPLDSTDIPDYSPTAGYTAINSTLARKEVTVSQDKGYQIRIDYLDLEDSHTTAIAYLNNKVRQGDVPTVDKYRLNKLKEGAGLSAVTGAITKSNFFEKYDTAVAAMIDAEIPVAGTIMFMTTSCYNALKRSDEVKRIIELKDKNIDANVEYIDSQTKIKVVPLGRMPANVQFILVNPAALICGVKRNISTLKSEPENFDGVLINRRLVHDLFVQEDRNKGVYVALTAAGN